MADQSPENLSDIEILDILTSMRNDELDAEANNIINPFDIPVDKVLIIPDVQDAINV